MQYTQPEAEGSFDHTHQNPNVMQQTQLPQQRTPNYNQKQQISSCESSATMAYMQGPEPMRYTKPEAEGSFGYSQQHRVRRSRHNLRSKERPTTTKNSKYIP